MVNLDCTNNKILTTLCYRYYVSQIHTTVYRRVNWLYSPTCFRTRKVLRSYETILLTIDKLNVGIEKFNISLTTYNTGEKEPSKNRIKSVLFLHHPYTRCDVLRGEATNFVLLVCSQSSWYLGEQRQGRQRIINSILTTDQWAVILKMVTTLFLILSLSLFTARVSAACRYSKTADMCCDRGKHSQNSRQRTSVNYFRH